MKKELPINFSQIKSVEKRAAELLFILEAGDAFPSGKLRFIRFIEYFAANGINASIAKHNSPYLIMLDQNPSKSLRFFRMTGGEYLLTALKKIIRNINKKNIIDLSASADIIWASKITDLKLMQNIRKVSNAPIILDIVDPYWLPEYYAPLLPEILSIVNAVTTDNEFNLPYLAKHNQNVFILPDAPQLKLFDKFRNLQQKNNNRITLGWVGSPENLLHLESIYSVIENLLTKYENLKLILLGCGYNSSPFNNLPQSKCEMIPYYDENLMVKKILEMDIGLFPLTNIPGAEHRGSLKSMNYIAGEAAVVASPLGENKMFIADGETGLLADSFDEWKEKIILLIENKELRKKITNNAIKRLRENYSEEIIFEKMCRIISSLANR